MTTDARVWIRIAQLLQMTARSLRRHLGRPQGSLGEADTMVLLRCASAEDRGVAQVQLAEQTGFSPAQISGAVERLRTSGLLDRHRPSDDRRRQHWHLTDSGRQRLTSALKELAPQTIILDRAISREEQHQLAQLLETLRKTCRQEPVDADSSPRRAA